MTAVQESGALGCFALTERFALESVPAFLFVVGGKVVDSVMGADVPSLVNKVKQHNLSASIAKGEDVSNASASSPAAAW